MRGSVFPGKARNAALQSLSVFLMLTVCLANAQDLNQGVLVSQININGVTVLERNDAGVRIDRQVRHITPSISIRAPRGRAETCTAALAGMGASLEKYSAMISFRVAKLPRSVR